MNEDTYIITLGDKTDAPSWFQTAWERESTERMSVTPYRFATTFGGDCLGYRVIDCLGRAKSFAAGDTVSRRDIYGRA